MNAGERAIEWLYKNQLQIDAEWSVRTERGFRWWPDRHAQTIELTGEVEGPDGATGSCIGVRTEVLRDLELTDSAAVAVNDLARAGANTMSGLVYDANTRRLDLCSLVLVHDDTLEWMQRLISIAAVLQIVEAQGMATTLVKHYGVKASEAISGHPTNGMRTTPDEMASIPQSVVVPMGQEPCTWVGEEFEDVVQQYMQRPPSLLATGDQTGFTVEFPYGDSSSLCQATTDSPHPAYGNGLRVTQSFPVTKSSDAEGARFALLMNAAELAGKPLGYGFGSYFYGEGLLCFSTFFPNFIHKPGLLSNLYFASVQRARALSMRFTGKDWTPETFSIKHSAVGRILWPEDQTQTGVAKPRVTTILGERKQLMYKIEAYGGEDVIYATPERALFHSQVMRALENSKTWAEFRRAMPRKEYSRLLREIFDDNKQPRPRGRDAFSMDQIPGASDADYPGWLQQEMLDGVLPADILEKYGRYGNSFVSGPCVSIRPEDLDEVNAELEKRGYELIDGSDLYMEG